MSAHYKAEAGGSDRMDTNPQTYFTDLLTRLVNGWPHARIDELMPWCWKPTATP